MVLAPPLPTHLPPGEGCSTLTELRFYNRYVGVPAACLNLSSPLRLPHAEVRLHQRHDGRATGHWLLLGTGPGRRHGAGHYRREHHLRAGGESTLCCSILRCHYE